MYDNLLHFAVLLFANAPLIPAPVSRRSNNDAQECFNGGSWSGNECNCQEERDAGELSHSTLSNPSDYRRCAQLRECTDVTYLTFNQYTPEHERLAHPPCLPRSVTCVRYSVLFGNCTVASCRDSEPACRCTFGIFKAVCSVYCLGATVWHNGRECVSCTDCWVMIGMVVCFVLFAFLITIFGFHVEREKRRQQQQQNRPITWPIASTTTRQQTTARQPAPVRSNEAPRSWSRTTHHVPANVQQQPLLVDLRRAEEQVTILVEPATDNPPTYNQVMKNS